jgi:hypothetical protein
MDHVTGQGIMKELTTFLDYPTRRSFEVGPWTNSFDNHQCRRKIVRFMFAAMSKFIDRGGSAGAGSKKMDGSIFKIVPRDVWAAIAVAAMVLIRAVFDGSPLLMFVLVGLAVWAYIAILNSPRYRG